MNRLLWLCLLALAAPAATAQIPTTSVRPPKEVVEEFWQLEINGGRLTPDGWRDANRFFVRPAPPPAKLRIRVINASSVWKPMNGAVKDGAAEIEVGVLAIWGIDEQMRFFVASETMKSGLLYKLTLTNTHWELNSDGTTRPEAGPIEWRLNEPGNGIWLYPDAAIRYVADVGDKTSDPEIRKNCLVTIKKLKAIHVYPTE